MLVAVLISLSSSTIMSLPDLIAYYLAVNYPSALEHFVQAAGISQPDLAHPPQPDLRSLVEDYVSNQIARDLSVMSVDERVMDGSWDKWTTSDIIKIELPKERKLEKVVSTIEGVSAANLLTVGVCNMPRREFDLFTATQVRSQPDQTCLITDIAPRIAQP